MKFAVIGAGAVGLLTACLLNEAGHDVQVIARRQEQAEAINGQGILKDKKVFYVPASVGLETIPPEAYVIIAVKFDAIESLLPVLQKHALDNPLVFLQNGMLHLQAVKKLPQANIAAGSVEHGALKINDREIRHTGNGMYKLALLKGDPEMFLPLTNINGLSAEWHKDADQLLFRKVLLNCLINPLTALTGLKNGGLLTNLHAYEMLTNLYTELYKAFPEIETLLPFEQVTALCASTAQNTSSMLADKLAGRKMELDTIILYTLKRSPIELPVLRTLYQLLKSSEV
ncbi:2-dehydropantoate 2-reductase [Planococcus sp. YIM B11945]|uniref:2-dehydropantoate 2-reductase n=1 Tax=Planococcus sp. YIM B11945 TaxID=3435410 RepID=UPI003D7CE821